MPDFPTIDDCLFCKAGRSPNDEMAWHDRPIMQVQQIGAGIPGLGAFVPGYVLLFPEMHVHSMLLLPPPIRALFRAFQREVLKLVSREFGPVTVFEHGTCASRDGRRSACLSHAHVHIIPGFYDLSQHVALPREAESSGPAASPQVLARSGYIYVHEPGGKPLYGRDPDISQYFRRRIADFLGIADEWDYLLFPRLSNVKETVDRLSSHLESRTGEVPFTPDEMSPPRLPHQIWTPLDGEGAA